MKKKAHAVKLIAMLCTAMAWTLPSRAVTFHRSFKNGYPAELNVSKEEANDTFAIKHGSVTYSNGRGRVVTQTTNTVIYVQERPGCRPPPTSRRPRANTRRGTPPRANKKN